MSVVWGVEIFDLLIEAHGEDDLRFALAHKPPGGGNKTQRANWARRCCTVTSRPLTTISVWMVLTRTPIAGTGLGLCDAKRSLATRLRATSLHRVAAPWF